MSRTYIALKREQRVFSYQEKHPWLWTFPVNFLKTALSDKLLQRDIKTYHMGTMAPSNTRWGINDRKQLRLEVWVLLRLFVFGLFVYFIYLFFVVLCKKTWLISHIHRCFVEPITYPSRLHEIFNSKQISFKLDDFLKVFLSNNENRKILSLSRLFDMPDWRNVLSKKTRTFNTNKDTITM